MTTEAPRSAVPAGPKPSVAAEPFAARSAVTDAQPTGVTGLDRAGIAERIPHSGTMCLLDGLLGWDAGRIDCTASGHRDADHPLRTAAGLLAPVAIEYASQAMALHGSLTAAPGRVPTPGFLASVRGVRTFVARLDDAAGPLRVSAMLQAGDTLQASYAFALHDATGRLLVDGRATVVLRPLSRNAPSAATVTPSAAVEASLEKPAR